MIGRPSSLRLVSLLAFFLPLVLQGMEGGGAEPRSGNDEAAHVEASPDTTLSRLKMLEGAVSYWGQVIQSRIAEKAITLAGEAGIAYGETTLRADSIRYDYERETLRAWGSPVLTDSGGEVRGSRMSYRLGEKRGIIEEGSTAYDQWLFKGRVVSKVGERDIYGQDSRFTTCDLPEPHYHFACSQLKLTIDDKVIARPVILYVRDIPVFFVPFYIFPIQKGRKSGLLRPKFGIFTDDRRGRSVTDLGYFFILNDYLDFTVSSDLYESARWSVRGEGRYARRYRYGGNIFYSFTDDALVSRRRSLLRFKHDHTINRDTSLRIEGNFASDRQIFSDISFDIDEVLQRSLESRATYNRRTPWGSYYITGYHDLSLGEERRARTQLPIFSLSKNSSPLLSGEGERWYNGITYGLNTRFESTRIERTGDEDEQEETVIYQASRTNLVLTDPLRIRGFLNVTPRLALSSSHYHTREDNTGYLHQETYETSVSLFTRLYGIFDRPVVGPMTRWRHTLSPQLTYLFRPDFDSERFSGLTGFPGAGGEASTIGIQLKNDFDAKYREGEEEKEISLLSVIQSTSYSTVRARQAGQSGWGDLTSRFESNPNDRLDFSVQMAHSLFEGERFDPFLTSLTITARLKGEGRGGEADTVPAVDTEDLGTGESEVSEIVSEEEYVAPRTLSRLPWSFSLTHSLSRSRINPASQSLYGTVSFNPTVKWWLIYSARYSFDEERVQNQRWTLRRDLHRWELLLSMDSLPGSRFRFEIRVNLIDLPALEFKRAVSDF